MSKQALNKMVVINSCRVCPYLEWLDRNSFENTHCAHPSTKIYTADYNPPQVLFDAIPAGCGLPDAEQPEKFTCPHCHQIVNGLNFGRHFLTKHYHHSS